MKTQFASKLFSAVWNIDKARGRAVLAEIARCLRAERPAVDLAGDPLPKMQIVGDVAVIPLRGVLTLAVPDWIKSFGLDLTDANDVAQEMAQAAADPAVKMLVLDVDSPGGLSLAGNKLFDLVEAINQRRPVFAWVGDGADMASAAYDAAAAARAILAGPYAGGVGCIGSYIAHLDDSAFWEAQGIKIETFRSGDLKNIDGALSPAQRDFLQGMVDEAGAHFRAHVAKYRTGVSPADMQGQWFDGAAAALRGFVSGTAADLPAAIAKFRKMI